MISFHLKHQKGKEEIKTSMNHLPKKKKKKSLVIPLYKNDLFNETFNVKESRDGQVERVTFVTLFNEY